jgi:tetratricopeptide (TPR) repeat protein
MAAGRWDEANEELHAFTARNPNVVEGWIVTMDLSIETENAFLSWYASRHLMSLDPHDETHTHNASMASAQLNIPFAALLYINTYLERWPDGIYSQDARKFQEATAALCDELLQQYPIAQGTDLEALRLFEEGQILVSHGRYKEGRQLSEMAAQLLPDFPPPRNNLALSYAVEGRLDRALVLSQKVLADHPDNIHARANTAQLLARLGRAGETQPILDSLRDEMPGPPDLWRKIMETFVQAGDDQAVIEVYQRARKALGRHRDLEPMAHHLAAVAYARSGDAGKAQKLWKSALKEDPELDLARDNLFDSRLPPGEQNGAWYLPFNHWLPKVWIERMLRAFQRAGQRGGDDDIRRSLERVIQAFPGLEVGLGLQLKQGDPLGIQTTLQMAEYIPISGLVEFALGQRGSDEHRMQAANLAVKHGLLDAGKSVTLYVEGEARQLMLLGFEIHDDYQPPDDLPDEALECLVAASDALYDDEPELALKWVEQGLGLAPDHATLLNEKVFVLVDLGRREEADALTRRNAKLHPDYLFARCAMARLSIREGKLDEAQDWLDPLMGRKRLSISEFTAFALAQIGLLMTRGEVEGAMSWVDMLEGVDPDLVPPVMSGFNRLRKRKDLSKLAPKEFAEELFGPDAPDILKRLTGKDEPADD